MRPSGARAALKAREIAAYRKGNEEALASDVMDAVKRDAWNAAIEAAAEIAQRYDDALSMGAPTKILALRKGPDLDGSPDRR